MAHAVFATGADRDAREAAHYDVVAERLATGRLVVRPDDLSDPDMPWLPEIGLPAFLTALTAAIGPLPGKRILDLGSGTGFLSIALAHRGASVDAVDISPTSVALTLERAAASGVEGRVAAHVGSADALPFADASLDAACGLFVLHHLDLEKSAAELARVLKPGAPCAFVETMGLNPLLVAARAALPGRFGIEKASTEDERPLDRRALDVLRARFGDTVRVAWPEVVCLRMAGYLKPLQHPAAKRVLGLGDRLLGMQPVRRLGYFGLVTFRNGAA